MWIPLLNEHLAQNETGRRIEREFSAIVKDIIEENPGVNLVHLEHILTNAVSVRCAEDRLRKSLAKRLEENAKRTHNLLPTDLKP